MSTFDVQFAINTYYPAANAAYQIQTVPNPVLPAGFALAGPLKADPQKAAALMAMAAPQQHAMVNAMLADSNIFGLVAWNATAKTAIIAFRGTQDAKDWLDDVDAVPVDYQAVEGIGLAHMGFQLVYEHVRGSLNTLLTSQCVGVQRILITGHSLGGAVAVLSGIRYLAQHRRGFRVGVLHLRGAARCRSGIFRKVQRGVSGLQPDRQFHGRGSAGPAAAAV
jgi:triacylglycerol lipase